MRGYRFYLEYRNVEAKRKGEPPVNVLALLLEREVGKGRGWPEGDKVTWKPMRKADGSYVCLAPRRLSVDHTIVPTYMPADALQNCRRISEAEAARIHPTLMEYLYTLEAEEMKPPNPEDRNPPYDSWTRQEYEAKRKRLRHRQS
jgi:hypothetical protein